MKKENVNAPAINNKGKCVEKLFFREVLFILLYGYSNSYFSSISA